MAAPLLTTARMTLTTRRSRAMRLPTPAIITPMLATMTVLPTAILRRTLHTMRHAAGNELAPDQFFDIAQIGQFGWLTQRNRNAGGTGARGAANAMDIGFRHVGKLEIDNVRDAVNINAARRNIGRDQDLHPA